MHFRRWLLLPIAIFALALGVGAQDNPTIVVASKTFAESRILGEIMAQLIESQTDLRVERKLGLGGTMICFEALRKGEVDVYAEYTGTGLVTILNKEPVKEPLKAYVQTARGFRNQYDLIWLAPFGFNNTYVLVMPEKIIQQTGFQRVSDLSGADFPVDGGFTHEFLQRPDGWPGLSKTYDLDFPVRGVEHALAYQAIQSGSINVMDAFSTDGKLLRFHLTPLEDDQNFFPPYQACPVVRRETLEAHPELRKALNSLAFRIDDQTMQRLNYQAEEEGKSFPAIASDFLEEMGLDAPPQQAAATGRGFWQLLLSRHMGSLLVEHLGLTLVAAGLATLVGVPLGIFITRKERLAQPVLTATGVIQTIPSLALLAFLIPIPFLGLGATSAIVALFLYALLPIVRNTYTGIKEVDPNLIEAARGMGLRESQILWKVKLPLSVRTIMAGVRTSTVIGVGVATLAAFIGAGGLGEPIITGLQLSDNLMILSGALPAAGLALFFEAALGRLEVVLAPRAA